MTATGRQVLLRYTSEENFSDWVAREAARWGWCGFRIRQSVAVVTGVHRLRRDGHSDAHGWPDWIFWKRGHRQIWAELKTLEGRTSPDQTRLHADIKATRDPPLVVVWRPTDENLVRQIFREAS